MSSVGLTFEAEWLGRQYSQFVGKAKSAHPGQEGDAEVVG